MALTDSTFPVTVTAADTQATLTIPTSVRGIVLTNLSAEDLRYAFKTAVVADPETLSGSRSTLPPGGAVNFGEVDFSAGAGTLYYASSLVGHRFDVRLSPEPIGQPSSQSLRGSASGGCGACG